MKVFPENPGRGTRVACKRMWQRQSEVHRPGAILEVKSTDPMGEGTNESQLREHRRSAGNPEKLPTCTGLVVESADRAERNRP